MQIEVFSATGSKVKTLALPASVFEAPINEGLMHQALMRQQGNRRLHTVHVKNRGEVQGSTRKLFAQKHTGQARRGAVRSPLLKGGGKAFGPRKERNPERAMPKQMRHAAIRSCLSLQAKKGAIVGIDQYPDSIKTKAMKLLLSKLPVELGRRILIVTGASHKSLQLSARNIENVKTIQAMYLNPEDVLGARHVIFLEDAIAKAEQIFGKRGEEKRAAAPTVKEAKKPAAKKAATKKVPAKKTASPSTAS